MPAPAPAALPQSSSTVARPTTDAVIAEQAENGTLQVNEFHDELIGHGRVATYRLSIRSGAAASFPSRSVTGTIYEKGAAGWTQPLVAELATFLRKIAATCTSTKPPRVVKIMTDEKRLERVCREVNERDPTTGNSFDRLHFFCGSTVFTLEAQCSVNYAVFWSFQHDMGVVSSHGDSMCAMQKLDSVKLERLYQQMQDNPPGERKCTAKGAWGRLYFYDFDNMTQTNVNSKRARMIARRAPTTSAALGTALNASVMKGAAGTVAESAPLLGSTRILLLEGDSAEGRRKREEADEAERQKQAHRLRVEMHKRKMHNRPKTASGGGADGSASPPGASAGLETVSPAESSASVVALVSTQNAASVSSLLASPTSALPTWLAELETSDNIPKDVLVELHTQRVDERTFLMLSASDLSGLGIPLGPRLALMKVVERKRQEAEEQSLLLSSSSTSAMKGNANSTSNHITSVSSTNSSNSTSTKEKQPADVAADPMVSECMAKLHAVFSKKTQIFDPADVEILAPIGAGGFGAVSEGLLFGQRPVAVKMFAEDGFDGGIEEALFLSSLHHRNVVQLVGVSIYYPKFRMPASPASLLNCSTGGSGTVNSNSGSDVLAPASKESGVPPTSVAQSAAAASAISASLNLSRYRSAPRFLMLLELADGNLTNVLQQAASDLHFDVVVRYVSQMAAAFEYVHGKNIVHRDIKPSNILVVADGLDLHLKLCDFGISRQIERAVDKTSRGGAGSSYYIAPEQATTNSVSAAADVFGLGVILVWLITGVNPSTLLPADRAECAEKAPDILACSLREKRRDGCPPFLLDLAIQCVQRDPRKRPQSGADVMQIVTENSEQLRRLVDLAAGKASSTTNEAVTEAMSGVTLTGW